MKAIIAEGTAKEIAALVEELHEKRDAKLDHTSINSAAKQAGDNFATSIMLHKLTPAQAREALALAWNKVSEMATLSHPWEKDRQCR